MDEMMVPGVQDQPRQPGNPGSRRQKPRAWRQASAEPSVKSTAIGELPCALSSTRRRDAACSGSSVARGTTLHYLSQQGIVSASRNSVETMEKGRRRVDRSTGTREGREEPRPLCPGETLNLSTGGRHIERAGEAENKRREEEVAQPIPRMLQSSTPTHGQVWGKDWKSHASPSPLQTDRTRASRPKLLGRQRVALGARTVLFRRRAGGSAGLLSAAGGRESTLHAAGGHNLVAALLCRANSRERFRVTWHGTMEHRWRLMELGSISRLAASYRRLSCRPSNVACVIGRLVLPIHMSALAGRAVSPVESEVVSGGGSATPVKGSRTRWPTR